MQKKRNYAQISSNFNTFRKSNTNNNWKKTRRTKNSQDENVDKNGSSQDKFESDFIDDDEAGDLTNVQFQPDDEFSMEYENSIRRKRDDEPPAQTNHTGKRKLKKMILSQNFEDGLPDDFDDDNDIQYDSDGSRQKMSSKPKSAKTKINQVEVSSDEEGEIYPGLPKMHGSDNDFRYSKKENGYFLKGDFCVAKEKYDQLFDHQKIGVQWLYSLWDRQLGAVLGDDMGLGKTVQVASYLNGLFDGDFIKKVLVVVPATMKNYWEEELGKWAPVAPQVLQFDDKKRDQRYKQMKSLRKRGGVLITSYGMASSEAMNLSDIRYDIIIIDEGHKAKNKNTQFRKDIASLKVKGHRVILTGTPLQNNLSELWSVFDIVQPKIFGSFEKFQREYAQPIEKGLLKGATALQKQNSQNLSKKLRENYQEHFLRRTKDNIFTIMSSETTKRPLKMTELPLKTDLVIWLPLSQQQKQIYKFMLQNQDLQKLMADRALQNAFFILSYIKKVCLHPFLLNDSSLQRKRDIGIISKEEEIVLEEKERQDEIRNSKEVTLNKRTRRGKQQQKEETSEEIKTEETNEVVEVKSSNGNNTKYKNQKKTMQEKFQIDQIMQSINKQHEQRKIDDLINSSSKTKLLFELMSTFKKEGHRVLIFSMSKQMLNLIEYMIQNKPQLKKDFKYQRIDGDTEIASREQLCKDFNKDKSIFCCLLTTKVGGFGLNLTGADRAIILDPDWNPANDNQAVDRCYRIGQKKDVIVYRLVSIGGLEELMYRRQVYKKAMNMATVDQGEVSDEKAFEKYFNNKDLFQLFQYKDDDENCDTLKLIQEKDGFEYVRTPTNLRHIKYLKNHCSEMVKGISVNSNLYTKKQEVDLVQEDQQNESSDNQSQSISKQEDNEVNDDSDDSQEVQERVPKRKVLPTSNDADIFISNKPKQEKPESNKPDDFAPNQDKQFKSEQNQDQKQQQDKMRELHKQIYSQYQDQFKNGVNQYGSKGVIRKTSSILESKTKQQNHLGNYFGKFKHSPGFSKPANALDSSPQQLQKSSTSPVNVFKQINNMQQQRIQSTQDENHPDQLEQQ